MNDNHVQQIFRHYIEQFEKINNPEHCEYFKWQVVKRFHDEMNETLDAPDEELPTKLYQMKVLSDPLIDSYTQPFYGLVKFAEKEPETVRNMFRELYKDDGGNLADRQNRIQEFLKQSHALRDKYYPNSFLYKDDMHSVTGYLFLYDPDHNYIFKATHAQSFANCIEFYDDWGSGESVKLDVYYRMCDQLVEKIKASSELMETDANRFENGWGADPSTFYADAEKHILAFDLIYCCSTYGLFNGITFKRLKNKERQLMQERKDKALSLWAKLEEAQIKYQKLEESRQYVNSVYAVGSVLHHEKYGDGTVIKNSGTTITVEFAGTREKQFGTVVSAVKGIVVSDADGYADKIKEYREILEQESSVKSRLSYAEKEFAPYAEYLG